MIPASISVPVGPHAHARKWWAKVFRFRDVLPEPDSIRYATDIPKPFLMKGTEELFWGDVLFTGKETDSGWRFHVAYLANDGTVHTVAPSAAHQNAMRNSGLCPALLKGSSDLAACVRLATFLRLGVPLPGVAPMAWN